MPSEKVKGCTALRTVGTDELRDCHFATNLGAVTGDDAHAKIPFIRIDSLMKLSAVYILSSAFFDHPSRVTIFLISCRINLVSVEFDARSYNICPNAWNQDSERRHLDEQDKSCTYQCQRLFRS